MEKKFGLPPSHLVPEIILHKFGQISQENLLINLVIAECALQLVYGHHVEAHTRIAQNCVKSTYLNILYWLKY